MVKKLVGQRCLRLPPFRIVLSAGSAGWLLLLISLLLLPIFIENAYYIHILVIVFINIIWASTYRLILRTGQLHFGHNGFIGIGAYTSALLVMKLGLSFWFAMPLAGITAGIIAVMIGYPALRLKGAYFAILTWSFATVMMYLYIRMEVPFGGNAGLTAIPPPQLAVPFIGAIDFIEKVPNYFLALFLLVMTLLILHRLETTRIGLTFDAIREADMLAKSVGVDIMRYKVIIFGICCGLAGIGGSFFAHYLSSIFPKDFDIILTIYLGAYVIVGGLTKFSGPIVGTALLIITSQVFMTFGFYRLMVNSILMIIILLFLPQGIISLRELILSAAAKSLGKWKGRTTKDGAT